jgi:hypothetical protein
VLFIAAVNRNAGSGFSEPFGLILVSSNAFLQDGKLNNSSPESNKGRYVVFMCVKI